MVPGERTGYCNPPKNVCTEAKITVDKIHSGTKTRLDFTSKHNNNVFSVCAVLISHTQPTLTLMMDD